MYLLKIEPTDVFQALSDPLRLRIIQVLSTAGDAGACSCDLSDALKEPEYSISRQLKILRTTGLLQAEKEGRWIYHRLRMDHPELRQIISVVIELSSESQAEDKKRLKRLMDERLGTRCKGREMPGVFSKAKEGSTNKREKVRRM